MDPSLPDWLHACGPRVFLFDWFQFMGACYAPKSSATASDGNSLLPPLRHFLRQIRYFSSSCRNSSSKRQKVDVIDAEPWLVSCAQLVRHVVADEWHRPSLSWFIKGDKNGPADESGPQTDWPNIFGKFDAATQLASGKWQPFLKVTMENASHQCCTLAIGM